MGVLLGLMRTHARALPGARAYDFKPFYRGSKVYIEHFNNTLRQRVGRLVRKALSFSKKLSNHIGAIWYFVHHYNASLRS